jgi:hypothetical protein
MEAAYIWFVVTVVILLGLSAAFCAGVYQAKGKFGHRNGLLVIAAALFGFAIWIIT